MFSLSKLLEKRGIDKIEDLSPEEKATFDRYSVVLTGEAVTVATIKEFCQTQIRVIEGLFARPNEENTDHFLKACLHVYLNILKAIEAPENERAQIEQQLTQLIQD